MSEQHNIDQVGTTGSTIPAREDLSDERLERKSHSSVRSRRTSASRTSRISDMIAARQAEAESARIALQYARKEADLLKQQAVKRTEMETDITLLNKEKEVAVAEAQVRVLISCCEPLGSVHHSQIHVPEDNPVERTKHYVATHGNGLPEVEHTPRQDYVYENSAPQQSFWHGVPTPMNPNALPFQPSSDLTRFLLKKDLLISRLRNFNDKPEAYPVWKASFRSVMGELNVNANEELDLLVKWLGAESSRHALSLRTANIHDPNKGLHRVWERLDERYGCPEMIERSLKSRISSFPKLTYRDHSRLYELSDLLSEVESIKSDEKYGPLLAHFDSSTGINPVVEKLPYTLQDRWASHAFRYKEKHKVAFPPFSIFVEFMRELSKLKNDPSFQYDTTSAPRKDSERSANVHNRTIVLAKKTEVSSSERETEHNIRCPLHKTGHTLNECKGFKALMFDERKEFLKKHGICYRCCLTSEHLAKACKENVQCAHCGSPRHATALHINHPSSNSRQADHGGEKGTRDTGYHNTDITSKCTQVCERPFQGKSCAKTLLVRVYSRDQPELVIKAYALVDDQSNATLARSELFDLLNIQSESVPYTLTSCGGLIKTSGRKACNLVVESLDGTSKLNLPTTTECNAIPSLREEIPTPEVARHHVHLQDIEQYIPPMDDSSNVLLLIGRDLIQAHHVLDQRVGASTSPYAQRLCLGWVIIGESCLGKVHIPDAVHVCKTSVLSDGRSSIFKPCTSAVNVMEHLYSEEAGDGNPSEEQPLDEDDNLGKTVFQVTPDDEKPGTSVDDRQFLQIMRTHMRRNTQGNWEAPLPFRLPKANLPNNRQQAWRRAKALDRSLQKSPEKKRHMIEFMDRIFQNKHAEIPPPLQEDDECWYLPLFGVYHAKKPSQIRVVFDSSALHDGKSLNNALLQGPDLANCLLGVLLRFRRETVAVMGDIQQMFHCFSVREDHRDFLRFIWYKDNDPQKDLVDYRMCVHVFGNRPSPAVAAYGLKRTAREAEAQFGEDVRQFIEHDFYVDDGLTSLDTAEQAIDLMKRSQEALSTCGNLRLCKIASNSPEVIEAFPPEDRAKDLKNLNLGEDTFPLQRCLGIAWDINSDLFTFHVSSEEKPYTKRGLLSTINSLFDPMGFAAPVLIKGKILLRDLMADQRSWDEPLSPERHEEWEVWRNSLKSLEQVHIPRTLLPVSYQGATERELHVYADASEKAIAAVAYIRVTDKGKDINTGFVMGKAKVSPTHGHTIPRLELCAAVLATEVANLVTEHLDIPQAAVSYHTDSKIVLGYICNESKRFSVYVANRVARIRRTSTPGQWRYISTEANPADCATRSVPATRLASSPWLLGPPAKELCADISDVLFSPSEYEVDYEVEQEVAVLATILKHGHGTLGTQRFERFSTWKRLVETISRLKHFAKTCHSGKPSQLKTGLSRVEAYAEAEKFVLRQVQREAYREEVRCLEARRPLPKSSSILNLNPVLDEDGLLRIGGRFNYTDMAIEYKNPIVIPGRHHIAVLLVRHYHDLAKHQGRHLTEGAVRAAGLWITGIKRVVSSLIHDCVKCRKLRGKEEQQVMSNLPTERLQPSPPFSYVGVDVFGPWSIVTRRTRGGQANSKRWAVLFTCLSSRGIHIEVIEEMSSSSFVNALRRFVAIRGKVQQFRSDRGTNFVGATDMLKIHAINVEDQPVKRMLSDNQCEWIFNPPQSSHMGGAWERLIGVARRILDSMMAEASSKPLTHEVLTTFMAEVCAIVNGRPIVPVSSDPASPLILTPATLLTQKTDQVTAPLVEADVKELYRAQWRRVQALAETFWKRWRSEYLHLLQVRRKWQHERPNVRKGDIVLLKEKNCHRNDWPTGILVNALPSDDGKVRKAVVKVHKNQKGTFLTRPVTDMVVLVSAEGQ